MATLGSLNVIGVRTHHPTLCRTRVTRQLGPSITPDCRTRQGLNRELQDAALGKLTTRICVKAESAGRRVWMVRPENTSRTCSQCGHTDKANRPDQATFACVSCGYEANADLNAAANIAARGEAAEAAWQEAGAPSLKRKKSRRRPREDTALTQAA